MPNKGPSWKRGTVKILWLTKTSPFERTIEVMAYTNPLYPSLVVSREPVASTRYAVTHVGSGKAFFRFLAKEDGWSAVAHLYSLEPDWEDVDLGLPVSRHYLAWLSVANTGHYGWNTRGTHIRPYREAQDPEPEPVPVEGARYGND